MKKSSLIYVAGHTGLMGSAIVRRLTRAGYSNLILKTRRELDLTDQRRTEAFFKRHRPEYVFVAAARVGGIQANSAYPAEFIYQNLMISANVIHAAYNSGVSKLLYLGSTCIYPKLAPQPMTEDLLLTGAIEPTNEPYAVAKIAGVKLCESYARQYGASFVAAIPCNSYGEGDNFGEGGHVVASFIRRFHEAGERGDKGVTVWGTGAPRREFIYSGDAADACLHLMRRYEGPGHINVGTGEDVSIRDLARMIARLTRFRGEVIFDTTKPDGTPRRLLDTERIRALGWRPRTTLEQGLGKTYRWFLKNRPR